MLKEIEKELMKLRNIKNQIMEAVENAPEGKLRCAINKGCHQYYWGKEYLGKERRDYVTQIAQKEYCLKLEEKIEIYQNMLEKLKSLYEKEDLEEVYRNLHPARKQLVEPLVRPVDEIVDEFEKTEYEGKGFDEDDKTEYFTIKGERVRSKSEKIIADELHRYNIPYKYEMPLLLDNWSKKIVVYPDFTALNKRTGGRWIIEHLGMMDKQSYYENAMHKIDIYERNGILLGEKLILFHESSNTPLNTNILKKYIELYLC